LFEESTIALVTICSPLLPYTVSANKKMPRRRRPVRSCSSVYRQKQLSDSDSSSEDDGGRDITDPMIAIPMEMEHSGFVMTPARINFTPTTPMLDNAVHPMDLDVSSLAQPLLNTTVETMVQSIPARSPTMQVHSEYTPCGKELSCGAAPSTSLQQRSTNDPTQSLLEISWSSVTVPLREFEQPLLEQQLPTHITAEISPRQPPSSELPQGCDGSLLLQLLQSSGSPFREPEPSLTEPSFTTPQLFSQNPTLTSEPITPELQRGCDSSLLSQSRNGLFSEQTAPDTIPQFPPPNAPPASSQPQSSITPETDMQQEHSIIVSTQTASSMPSGPMQPPVGNMVICPWCARQFTTRSGLGTHKRFCERKPTEDRNEHRNGVTIHGAGLQPQIPALGAPATVPHRGVSNNTSSAAANVALQSRESNVVWGEKTIDEVLHNANSIYDKVAFFRQNLFKLPSGHAGKDFIRECTRLVKAWSTDSILKGVAWKCLMIMPALLLQKPSSVSKSKDHTAALKRRLSIWQRGDFQELLRECLTIQGRIKASVPRNNIEATSKKFASLMKNGKLNAAVKLLTNSMEGGILPLTEETMTLLQTKHPAPADLSEEAVVDIEPVASHPVVFEEINGDAVRTAALNTHGGAGPSGLDADGWRHILVSRNFGIASEEFRSEFANAIKKLCTEKVEVTMQNGYATSDIEAFLSCRLIPLDKCPGLRPIGIGEVLRRIAGKVFMAVVKGDVQDSVGSLQVCAGQAGGCEAAIHAMRTLYESEDTDAVLLIDAANAFNSINRAAMLKNIERICPAAYLYAYNCYATHARLFVLGGKEIRSMEGTTQGDPPSMAFYAIGLLPLIWCLAESNDPAKQVAYADDLTGGGKLSQLKRWLDAIVENGPRMGYNAEPTKSWLIVKEEKQNEAEAIFQNSGVNITTHGKKHLGAAIGSIDHRHEFVTGLVDKWVQQIEMLSKIALYEPHAAYIAFTSCLRHRYSFYLRTIPSIGPILQPLENAIRTKLIPALTEGRDVSDDERRLLSLPPRLGGMGLIMPTEMADQEFEFSKRATVDLTNAIIDQTRELPPDLERKSKEAKSGIRKDRKDNQNAILEDLVLRMTPAQKRANEINREAGASNWLTALPIEDKGFHLNKREFWDAINLRHTWPISRLPSKCACGSPFDVGHALSCKKGGFVGLRHNAIRDMTADLLSEVCPDVCIEPHLQELTGESLSARSANTSREARLDISARNVWSRNQRAFFDVRVFNPNARRFQNQSLPQAYLANEREKKNHYNERVLEVENGTFTPLVFSVHGGMGQECRMFYKRLSSLLSEKRGENYSMVASWVRTRTSFSLLRSALMSIRGTRHRYYQPKVAEVDIELDLAETTVRPV